MKKKPAPPASRSEIATKIKAANETVLLRRAAEKVKAGKPLTAREERACAAAQNDLIMASSMGHASALLDTPLPILKKAKRAGAPGFRSNSSVCITELKPWLEANIETLTAENPEGKETLECRRLLAQCEKLEFQNSVERGQYIHLEEIERQARVVAATTRNEFLRIKADAPTWAGLDPAEIDRRVSRLIDAACHALHDTKNYK